MCGFGSAFSPFKDVKMTNIGRNAALKTVIKLAPKIFTTVLVIFNAFIITSKHFDVPIVT